MNRGGRRFYRTMVLGVLAMGALVWAAMDQFGISRQEMSEMFLATLLAVGLVICGAAVAVLLWIGLRTLLGRGEDP